MRILLTVAMVFGLFLMPGAIEKVEARRSNFSFGLFLGGLSYVAPPTYYVQPQPVYVPQPYYVAPQPYYVAPQSYYVAPQPYYRHVSCGPAYYY